MGGATTIGIGRLGIIGGAVVLAGLGFAPGAVAGQCDGVVVVVDNDDPGSGYAEINPENFQTHNVDACAGTYRYLSKYVGDLSTDGRVTWQPTITVPGTYRVTTSFRASENRTDDADYRLVGDDGQQQATVIDQRGDGCTQVELGEIWCVPGGSCRLELDGTDDTKSDAADATTFELVDCDPPEPPPAGQCDPLLEAGFEVCASGPGRCEGVYTGGEGCIAYCATVGMECVARFGGEPGCMQEALEIPCDEVNDHGSNYCVCEGDPPVGTTGTGGDVTGGGVDDGVVTAADDAGSTGAGASSGADTSDVPGGGSGATAGALPPGGTGDRGSSTGCGCAASTDATGGWWSVFAVAAALRSRRRRSAAIAAILTTTAACAGDVEESAASATATDGSTSSGTTTAVSATDPTSSGSPTSATTDPTETSATTDPSTSTEGTTTGSETTADPTATDGSSSSGAVDESSSTTMSTRGMVCMADADCDGSAPFCVYNQCRDGSEDDACLDDNDCVDAPACVYNHCSVGDEYDGCLDDNDCNDGAPDCVYNQCHDGSTFDPCLDDNDCGGAPFCVYNQCRDGVEFDPCADDNDCDDAAPHCAQAQCHDGGAGDPCDAADDCENDCGPNLVCG